MTWGMKGRPAVGNVWLGRRPGNCRFEICTNTGAMHDSAYELSVSFWLSPGR
jgi:hypothetical protein